MSNDCKYRNIIFDLGGVLVYFSIAKTIQSMIERGKDIPDVVAHNVVRANLMQEHLEYNRGVLTKEEYIQQVAIKLFTEKSHQNIAREILYDSEALPMPLDDGIALLKMVKDRGYKVFALSNLTHGAYQKIIAHRSDFFELFDGAIFSYKVKVVKPEPMIYQKLLQEYNLDVDQCFFIDDVHMNVAAAKALGIDGMVYHNAEQALHDMILLKMLPEYF